MVFTLHYTFPKLSTPTVTPQGNNLGVSQHFPAIPHQLAPVACSPSILPLLPPKLQAPLLDHPPAHPMLLLGVGGRKKQH